MHLWKAIAATGLIVSVVGGCTHPQSMTMSQPVGIQRGDSFALLSEARAGSVGAAHDGVVLTALANHLGGAVVPDAPRWQVEYSFSARPVQIAMTGAIGAQTQPIGLPAPDYLLDCKRFSFRMTLRVVDATNGAPAYQGSAEEQACATSTAEQEAIFARFATSLVAGIALQ